MGKFAKSFIFATSRSFVIVTQMSFVPIIRFGVIFRLQKIKPPLRQVHV